MRKEKGGKLFEGSLWEEMYMQPVTRIILFLIVDICWISKNESILRYIKQMGTMDA